MPGIGITGGRFGGGGGGGGATVTIGVYSDIGLTTPITSADFEQVVYIDLNVAGITTPTEYRFLIFNASNNGVLYIEAGTPLTYTISSFNNLLIYGEATDGTDVAAALTAFELTINADADANAFINAHNTASGQAMGAVQQTAIQGTFQRFKGIGTTNGSDLWTKLVACNSEIYPFVPVDDLTVSIAAYALDMVDPSTPAIWYGFVPSDYSVTGITGGIGKYLAMKRAPSDFGQNDVGTDAYSRNATGNYNTRAYMGAVTTDINSNGVIPIISTSLGGYKINSTSFEGHNTNGIGLHSHNRNGASTNQLYKDGVLVYSGTIASVAPTTNKFYGFAYNKNGTSDRNFVGELAMICDRCSFNAVEMSDWFEVWDYYQTNVITGGRNV